MSDGDPTGSTDARTDDQPGADPPEGTDEADDGAGAPGDAGTDDGDGSTAASERSTVEAAEAAVEDLTDAEDDRDRVDLARALADAVEARADRDDPGDRERAADHLERLADLHDGADPAVGAALSRAVVALCELDADDRAYDRVADRIDRVQAVHETHETEQTAGWLAEALVVESRAHYHGSDDEGDLDVVHQNRQFVDSLSNQFPGETVARRLAAALGLAGRASYREDDHDDVLDDARRIEGIYRQYDRPAVAEALAGLLATKMWVHGENGDREAMAAAIDRAEELYEAHRTDRLAAQVARVYGNAVSRYCIDDDFQGAEATLERLRELPLVAVGDELPVADLRAFALERLAHHYRAAGDREAARGALDRLRDLHAERPAETIEGVADALEAAVEAALDDDDLDRARDLAAELRSAVDAAADARRTATGTLDDEDRPVGHRLTAAAASFRVDARRGEAGAAPGEWSATVEADGDGATVTVADPYGIDHRVTLTGDGALRTHEVPGLDDAFGDRSPLERELLAQARRQARWRATRAGGESEAGDADGADDRESDGESGVDEAGSDPAVEVDVDAYPSRLHPDRVRAARRAVEETDDERFRALFGRYVDQHASFFVEDMPFVDPVDPPVETDVDVTDDVLALVETGLVVDDSTGRDREGDGEAPTVDATTGVAVAVLEEDRRVVAAEDEFDPDAHDARLQLPIRPLFRTDRGRDQVVAGLRAAQRDAHLLLGVEPPESARIVGWGTHDLAAVCADAGDDGYPYLPDRDTDLPGYDSPVDVLGDLFGQLRAEIDERFADRSRSASTAYEAADDAGMVPRYPRLEVRRPDGDDAAEGPDGEDGSEGVF